MKNYALNINLEDVDGEIWKPVLTYGGRYSEFYEISNRGRVKSLRREVFTGRGGSWFTKERILKQSINKKKKNCKYYFVGLCLNKFHKTPEIHILMADAFLEKEDGKNMVIHKDHNTLLNWVENIKRVSGSDKLIQAIKMGKFTPPGLGKFGGDAGSARAVNRFSIEGIKLASYLSQVDAALWLVDCGYASKDININHILSSIAKAAKGISESSYGFRWSYNDFANKINYQKKKPLKTPDKFLKQRRNVDERSVANQAK